MKLSSLSSSFFVLMVIGCFWLWVYNFLDLLLLRLLHFGIFILLGRLRELDLFIPRLNPKVDN